MTANPMSNIAFDIKVRADKKHTDTPGVFKNQKQNVSLQRFAAVHIEDI
jgi:hypothetical protein